MVRTPWTATVGFPPQGVPAILSRRRFSDT
jgi:hypothetical protein